MFSYPFRRSYFRLNLCFFFPMSGSLVIIAKLSDKIKINFQNIKRKKKGDSVSDRTTVETFKRTH